MLNLFRRSSSNNAELKDEICGSLTFIAVHVQSIYDHTLSRNLDFSDMICYAAILLFYFICAAAQIIRNTTILLQRL